MWKSSFLFQILTILKYFKIIFIFQKNLLIKNSMTILKKSIRIQSLSYAMFPHMSSSLSSCKMLLVFKQLISWLSLHAWEHSIPCLQQDHLFVSQFILQLHLMIFRSFSRAGGNVVLIWSNLLSSTCHPYTLGSISSLFPIHIWV